MNEQENIKRFADQMQIELDNNLAKGSILKWKGGTREQLSELEYHKAKLLMAMKVQDFTAIKEYIADCANILMAIGNSYNLYRERSEERRVGKECRL